MIDEFNKEMAAMNGTKIQVFKFGSLDGFETTIATSITKSISRSQSMSFHDGFRKEIKPYKVGKIDWSIFKFKSYDAVHSLAKHPKSIELIKDKLIYEAKDAKVLIAADPFDKGSLRFAFAAMMLDEKSGASRKLVAKESIFVDAKYNTQEYYEDLIENQIVAAYLADLFLKMDKCEKMIRFVDVSLIYVKETGKYYSLEEYVDGEFIKWNNNAGFVNEDSYACTLNAFSHWTYLITNEYLVVTDLQGFELNDKEYLLTDPAIACPDGLLRFTSTNLGSKGLRKFFESHQCNAICKGLDLKRHKHQLLPDKDSSTMVGTKIST
jgi:hypothetical protein